MREKADGDVQVIVAFDGFKSECEAADVALNFEERQGIRFIMNQVAKLAGKYLMKLDAHCALSSHWDTRMKESCTPTVLVTTMVDTLDDEAWMGIGRDMSFVTLNGNLQTRYIQPWLKDRKPEEETLAMIGCCWMIQTAYYRTLRGCDEELGVWGYLGAEWCLKVWCTGGRVIIRTDVTCAHLFRKETPFEVGVKQKKMAPVKLVKQWLYGEDDRAVHNGAWLVDKFSYFKNGDKEYQIDLFGLGSGYAIRSEDKKFLTDFVKDNEIETIVEFGCGKSTIMFDMLGCFVTSYETIGPLARTVDMLLSGKSGVFEYDGTIPECDMLFIDGPKGGENREENYKIAGKSKAKYIACHDTNRKPEQKWVDKYLADRMEVATNGVTTIYV